MPTPPHYQHDVTSIDGLTYCETCHVDLTDKDVCALERHDRLEALAFLSENEKAIHETILFFIEEGVLPAPPPYHRGMGGEQALQMVREQIVLKRQKREEAESTAVASRRFEQRRRAERIYERVVAEMLARKLSGDRTELRELRELRASTEAAAAVWDAE